jgi:hypothetical protein
MRLTAPHIEASPLGDNRTRLVGKVVYQDGAHEPYWFDVREQFAEFLSASGNPWLTTLLPLAVCTNEPLEMDVPVDRLLYENLHELMYVWKAWHPELPMVKIAAPVTETASVPERRRTGQFFTGGVDSLFTALRHTRSFHSDAPCETDDLISICGYDIPLRNADAYAGRYARQQRAAAELGKEVIDIFTNARETAIARINRVGPVDATFWWKICHACGLAGLAHSLEKRFRKVFISSSYTYSQFSGVPYATNPLTDHLLSTSNLNVFHYGSAFKRVEKVLYIAPSDVALRTLQVCFHQETEENCGYCLKCLQTMIALEIAGALERAVTFPVNSLDLARVGRILPSPAEVPFIRELGEQARAHGKMELAEALEKSVRRAELLRRRRRLKDWLTGKPVVWRLAGPVRRSIRKMKADSVVWVPNAAQRAASAGNGQRSREASESAV